MPNKLSPAKAFKVVQKESDRALVGMWVCSASPIMAEICAGSGLDWILLDAEHSPNGLESILAQLHAVSAYSILPVVRPPANDPVLIKQFLDLGVETLLIPMVDTAEQATQAIEAAHYPPSGIRGVGAALARSARWNRTPDYLRTASERVTVLVQIESTTAVDNIEEILAVEGLDGVFIGPSDLAASLGILGQQSHPSVLDCIARVIAAAKAVGVPVGINSFDETAANGFISAGIDFVLVGADVAILARQSEALAATYITNSAVGRQPASVLESY